MPRSASRHMACRSHEGPCCHDISAGTHEADWAAEDWVAEGWAAEAEGLRPAAVGSGELHRHRARQAAERA